MEVVANIVRDFDADFIVLPTLRNDISGTSVTWGDVDMPFYRFRCELQHAIELEYTP